MISAVLVVLVSQNTAISPKKAKADAALR